MDPIQILGFVAGCFTSSSTIPQIIKTYKTKDVKDISILMFSVLAIGVSLWVIYGFMKKDWPIIITNLVALALSITMIFFKLRFR